VVAAIPTGAILFIGALWLGAQTLTDISVDLRRNDRRRVLDAVRRGPAVSLLRENEPEIKARDARVLAARERAAVDA
jgi:preprotein translocase subunit SecF